MKGDKNNLSIKEYLDEIERYHKQSLKKYYIWRIQLATAVNCVSSKDTD